MFRIASGTTDQYLYFNAGVTGLSSFTVYRSRNGAAFAAMTTPSVSEMKLPTSPETPTGWYRLLVDEDTTIDGGNTTEAMLFYITASGMTPKSVEIELFAPPVTSVDSAATIADAVWDEAQSGHVAAGSFGEVATEIASILVDTGTTLDTSITSIKNKTDSLTFTSSGKVDANVLEVDSVGTGRITGTAVTGTLSTTQATTDLTGYANDELIGRVIVFLTGTAAGQASDITDYANASGLVTFTAITTAPVNNDTFVIV